MNSVTAATFLLDPHMLRGDIHAAADTILGWRGGCNAQQEIQLEHDRSKALGDESSIIFRPC